MTEKLFSLSAVKTVSKNLTASSSPINVDDTTFIKSKANQLFMQLFGKINQGNIIQYCTAGQFSTHQLIQYLISITGPANVYLSTWALKEEPARVLYYLKKTGKIKQLNCVFDYRIRTLDAKHFDFLNNLIDNYALTKNHSKTIAIEGEKMSLAVISSANMSNNPRIETGCIICTTESMQFHKNWMMEIINGKKIA